MALHYTRDVIMDNLHYSFEPFTIELGPDDTAYDPETGDTLLGPATITYAHGTFPGPAYTATIETDR